MNRCQHIQDRLTAHVDGESDPRTRQHVEEHLLTAADPKDFLRKEEEKWLVRYTAWAERVDLGIASKEDLSQTAFDYLETIDAIRKRAGQCST